jgi:hypothetical protein
MNHGPEGEPLGEEASGPIALDGLVYGIDLLDAVLVFHLGDANLHATWVRPDTGLRAEDMVTGLRDGYRVCQFAARRFAPPSATTGFERRGDVVNPLVTIEVPPRVALLRRIRAYVVATIFDGGMPLGMARLLAARIAAVLDPELPLGQDAGAPGALPAPSKIKIPPPPMAPDREEAHDRAPATLAFGAGLARRSVPPPPPSAGSELDRTRRLLAYLEAHAPEPHMARHRLALRAGLTLLALEHPEALGPEAIVLIETAVEDILGLDRAELRRIA